GDLGLTKHSYDLRFGKMALSHSNLLSSRYEKIQLMHPLNHGEDYHDVDGARGCAVPIPAGGAALSQTTAGLAADSTGRAGWWRDRSRGSSRQAGPRFVGRPATHRH